MVAFLLSADCENPEPLHPCGWVWGTCANIIYTQNTTKVKGTQYYRHRVIDGFKVLVLGHIPFQPVEDRHGNDRHSRIDTYRKISSAVVVGFSDFSFLFFFPGEFWIIFFGFAGFSVQINFVPLIV